MVLLENRLLQVLSIVIVLNQTFGYLLPDVAVPIHYDLDLKVEFSPTLQYKGVVEIKINVNKPTKSLYLHSKGLELDQSGTFLIDGRTSINAQNFLYDSNMQILTITMATQIPTGIHTLVVPFSGKYFTTTTGLFLDKYIRSDGVTRYLLTTHFEPAYAREMFPCFDEPNLRATFSVRVAHPSDYNAISNTEVDSVLKYGETTITSFKKTPLLPTYLLGLSVSDFVAFKNYTVPVTNTAIRVYVEPSRLHNAIFAHKISVDSVDYFQKMLLVKYSLPKLDSVAVRIFGGGMENWGLIVYGTSIISSGPNMSDGEKMGTTSLICHEIAHQWFGNLVSIYWWDYLWLKEGFATFYAEKCADKIFPKFRNMYNHVVDFQYTLREDSNLATTQDLNFHVENPLHFMSKFGLISYQKASAVIRMMSIIFPGFDNAMTDYLTTHSEKNTVPKDLFDSLAKFETGLPEGITVQGVMDGWTNNAGFPLITLSATISNGDTTVVVSQKRFALDEDYKNDVKWWIPISVAYETTTNFEQLKPKFWLEDTQEKKTFNITNHSGWIIANLQQTVFCRVNYDEENWQKIITYLQGKLFAKIHVVNRAQLIDDIVTFGKAGIVKPSLVLELLKYLEQETDDIPLRVSKHGFKMYSDFLRGTDAFRKYQKFVENIFGTDEALELLEEPNLELLVTDALEKMPNRDTKAIAAFDDAAERITSEIQWPRVRMAIGPALRSVDPQMIEFVRKLESRAASNIYHRTQFLRNHYHEVNEWLKKNI